MSGRGKFLGTRLHDISRRLTKSLELLAGGKSNGQRKLDVAFEAIESYERLSSEVYRLRSISGADVQSARAAAEDLLDTSAHELVNLTGSNSKSDSAYTLFISEYRQIWRRHFGLFFFATCFFLAMVLVGWNVGVHQPDYLSLILPQQFLEQIHDNNAWFRKLNENPWSGGLSIALNNIKVALTGFLFGALLGFGGLFILGLNGFYFGGVLGYCRTHQFDLPLLNFVASHGPLELTIIIASCFAGLLIGRVFYLRPRRLFASRMREAAREAGVLALGIIPWLMLAAIFEAGISPREHISVTWKIAAGIAIALGFWTWSLLELAPFAVDQKLKKRK